jgi:alpha-tubulin suppressor-like RCC1 family protein
VYCFGTNKFGQCGREDTKKHVFLPSRISALTSCKSIDTGFQHNAAATHAGLVYTWGKGKRGQLGNGKTDEFSSAPVRVKGLEGIDTVSTGFNHTAALCSNGTVYIWGKHMSTTKKESIGTVVVVLLWNDSMVF